MMAKTRIIRIHPRWNLTTIYWIFIKYIETWDQTAIPRLKTLDAVTWLWLGGMHPAVWGFSGKLQRLQICNTKLLRRWGQTLFWVADHVLALSEKEKKNVFAISGVIHLHPWVASPVRCFPFPREGHAPSAGSLFASAPSTSTMVVFFFSSSLLFLKPLIWRLNDMYEWLNFTSDVLQIAGHAVAVISKVAVSLLAGGRLFFRPDVQKCILNLSVFIRAWHKAFN